MPSRKAFRSSLQRRDMNLVSNQSEVSFVVRFLKIDGEPGNVSAGKIIDFFHMPQRREEMLIDNNSHLLPPPSKRRHLNLQLGHQSLGPAASIVRSACLARKWWPVAYECLDTLKLSCHALARKVDRLYLQSAPIQYRRLTLPVRQNHIYPPYVCIAIFRLEKTYLSYYFGCRSTKNGLTNPLKYRHIIFESPRAKYPQSVFVIQCRDGKPIVVPIKTEGTDSTFLGT